MGGWGGGLEAPHEAPHILECKGTTALMGRGGGQSREMSCHVIRSWSEQFAIEGRAKERERETERSEGGGGDRGRDVKLKRHVLYVSHIMLIWPGHAMLMLSYVVRIATRNSI